jgi:hypothetical protein
MGLASPWRQDACACPEVHLEGQQSQERAHQCGQNVIDIKDERCTPRLHNLPSQEPQCREHENQATDSLRPGRLLRA